MAIENQNTPVETDDLWSRLRESMERLATFGQRKTDPAALREKLAARAKQLRGHAATGGSTEAVLMILAFNKGNQRYGIPIHDVIEVQTLEHFSPVPGTPSFISGVIQWRGDVLSLLDLSKLFEIAESGIADIHVFLIVETDGRRVAVVALEIEEILAVPSSEMTPVPELPGNIPPEWLFGVHDNNRLILRMDMILRDKRLVDWRQSIVSAKQRNSLCD
ncbi:MAG TPA: chemotaxis protein CheW [Pirellulaceae bacterium]|nr:chemotaxis protein CheW [Pirellulaceae bacterium]